MVQHTSTLHSHFCNHDGSKGKEKCMSLAIRTHIPTHQHIEHEHDGAVTMHFFIIVIIILGILEHKCSTTRYSWADKTTRVAVLSDVDL